MSFRKILLIVKKEFLLLIKDKKHLFMLFFFPLVFLPLCGLFGGLMGLAMTKEDKINIAIDVDMKDDRIVKYIENYKELDIENIIYINEIGAISCINNGEVDYYISYDSSYLITYKSSNSNTSSLDILEKCFKDYEDSLNKKTSIIKFKENDLSKPEEIIGDIAGTILPFMIIYMLSIQLMSLVPDITAGEKDRKTQETLLSFPIKPNEILFGKTIYSSLVSILTLFTFAINILLILFILKINTSLLDNINLSIFVPSVLLCVIVLLPLSLFLSAVCIAVCSFAKTNAQASSVLSPVIIIITVSAYLSFINIKITPMLCFVPILNIALIIQDIIKLNYNIVYISLVCFSNIIYTITIIYFLSKVYSSDRLLLNDDYGSIFNRPTEVIKGSTPKPSDLIFVFPISIWIFILSGILLLSLPPLLGNSISQFLILLIPLLFCIFTRVDLKETFSLKKIPLISIPVLFIIAIGIFLFGNSLTDFIINLFNISSDSFNQVEEIIFGNSSFITQLICVALVPAICEEFMFRGYIQSSLKNHTKLITTLIITSLLFAIFHMNIVQGIYAFTLGIIMSYIVYKSGSLLSSSIIHFICNSIAICFSFFLTNSDSNAILEQEINIIYYLPIILIGLAITFIGILLLNKIYKNKKYQNN